MTSKQFTLYNSSPDVPPQVIQFYGIEYQTVHEASKTTIGQYGHLHALRILGRVFVLNNEEAQVIFKHEIPFTAGVSNGKESISLPGKSHDDAIHFKWIDANDAIDWQELRDSLESIRDKIGEQIDWLGKIGGKYDPRASEITQEDHRALCKIQETLNDACNLILGVTPIIATKS